GSGDCSIGAWGAQLPLVRLSLKPDVAVGDWRGVASWGPHSRYNGTHVLHGVRRPMSQTARTVLPTDLVALVSYDGRVYANEAMTRDRIGSDDSPHPIGAAFEQWFNFATGRH